jgi:hypothetical protein
LPVQNSRPDKVAECRHWRNCFKAVARR